MRPIVERFTHAEWLSNCWLLADRPGGEGLLVDTGVPVEPVLEAVRRLGVKIRWIVNTHHHHDHVAGNARLHAELGAPVAAHALDAARMSGVDRLLGEGDRADAGALKAHVLHIPGHTTGQIALVVETAGGSSPSEPGFVLTGDTLFRRSIGGTMAPGHGTFEELRASLLDRLLALPPETVVLPGHGEPTTIGEERDHNPFLRVLRGVDPPGEGQCRFAGRPARLIVWGRDYDGGFKAMVRFPDGSEAVVPGSRVTDRTIAGHDA